MTLSIGNRLFVCRTIIQWRCAHKFFIVSFALQKYFCFVFVYSRCLKWNINLQQKFYSFFFAHNFTFTVNFRQTLCFRVFLCFLPSPFLFLSNSSHASSTSTPCIYLRVIKNIINWNRHLIVSLISFCLAFALVLCMCEWAPFSIFLFSSALATFESLLPSSKRNGIEKNGKCFYETQKSTWIIAVVMRNDCPTHFRWLLLLAAHKFRISLFDFLIRCQIQSCSFAPFFCHRQQYYLSKS